LKSKPYNLNTPFKLGQHWYPWSRKMSVIDQIVLQTEEWFVRITLRLVPYRQSFRLGTSPLRLTTSSFFQLNTSFHIPSVTSSQTKGWVYRLQLLLGLASADILGSESRGTHGHILFEPSTESDFCSFILCLYKTEDRLMFCAFFVNCFHFSFKSFVSLGSLPLCSGRAFYIFMKSSLQYSHVHFRNIYGRNMFTPYSHVSQWICLPVRASAEYRQIHIYLYYNNTITIFRTHT
jgi:hypothetical protein